MNKIIIGYEEIENSCVKNYSVYKYSNTTSVGNHHTTERGLTIKFKGTAEEERLFWIDIIKNNYSFFGLSEDDISEFILDTKRKVIDRKEKEHLIDRNPNTIKNIIIAIAISVAVLLFFSYL